MSTIRAIFFDAVGTVIHPEPGAAQVYAEAGRHFGSRLGLEVIAQRFRQAFRRQEEVDRAQGWTTSAARELQRWRDIVGEVLDDVHEPHACFDFLYRHFAQTTAWRCEPGIAEVCTALRALGYQLGLASNFDERLFGLVQELAPLELLRGHVVVSSAEGCRKPAAAFFAALCRTAALAPAQILYVGDDPANDYAGAEAVGMTAVLFDPHGKYTTRPVRRIGALEEVLTFATPLATPLPYNS